jgi:hypothetical protein
MISRIARARLPRFATAPPEWRSRGHRTVVIWSSKMTVCHVFLRFGRMPWAARAMRRQTAFIAKPTVRHRGNIEP